MDPSMGQERRTPVTPSSSSRYNRRRSSGSRDERYRSDVHTEAVQAALAKHKERKMAVPMPSKRRSLVVQTSMDAYTPPVWWVVAMAVIHVSTVLMSFNECVNEAITCLAEG
ncbi:DIP2 disco-interacting protein 2 C [Ameca splendens]|uniref:DIP2 disco-interacting protein 2 C n=3 Tax=Goodeidae TaxID=28758 RepID=A0ABV0Q134_9TELE|nr:DIP2 disco-interacting protein 2 C [Characodon lateralis]